MIDGNANAFNAQKYGLLLSDKIASKLFNTTKSLIGKSVAWSKGEFKSSYIVAGVFQSPPENATDQFDLLFNYELFKET